MRFLVFNLFTVFFLIFSELHSQNPENAWLISLNSNIINLQGNTTEKGFNFGGPAISLSRYLGAGISIGTAYSLGNVKNYNSDFNYSSVDGFLKFNLLNGSISPFLVGGYGFSQFSDGIDRPGFFPSTETSRTFFGGLGFNIFLTKNFALNFQSTIRIMNETAGFDHLQNFIGISYGFGGSDADKDGVSDKKDKCPSVPGLKEYEGCPDTDGDKIIDKEDSCPEVPGLLEFNGCLDSDGDGISDPEDKCPNEPGKTEMNGCPDNDGDGVSDDLDDCKTAPGPLENNGCPWPDSDGDGINDNDDLCIDEQGTIENNGCPELSNEIVKTLNEFSSRINFVANSYTIFGRKTLEKIKNLLMENPKGSLLIEGFASSDGDQAYNIELSVKRAEAVRNFLIGLGVQAERLEVQGYGEDNPIGDNKLPEGRAINRRVQFKSKLN